MHLNPFVLSDTMAPHYYLTLYMLIRCVILSGYTTRLLLLCNYWSNLLFTEEVPIFVNQYGKLGWSFRMYQP